MCERDGDGGEAGGHLSTGCLTPSAKTRCSYWSLTQALPKSTAFCSGKQNSQHEIASTTFVQVHLAGSRRPAQLGLLLAPARQAPWWRGLSGGLGWGHRSELGRQERRLGLWLRPSAEPTGTSPCIRKPLAGRPGSMFCSALGLSPGEGCMKSTRFPPLIWRQRRKLRGGTQASRVEAAVITACRASVCVAGIELLAGGGQGGAPVPACLHLPGPKSRRQMGWCLLARDAGRPVLATSAEASALRGRGAHPTCPTLAYPELPAGFRTSQCDRPPDLPRAACRQGGDPAPEGRCGPTTGCGGSSLGRRC